MDIEHVVKGNILVVSLQSDRLDARDSTEFKHHVLHLINETGKKQIVFDLSKLTFIDSSGVGILLSILRFLNSQEGELKLAGVTQPVRTLLELVSIHKIFEILNTKEEAIESFNSPTHSPKKR